MKHLKNCSFVLAAFLLASTPCLGEEGNIFACQAPNGVSIQLEQLDSDKLAYTFSRHGKVELRYESADFKYFEYSRPMTSYANVSFKTGKYKYEIYSDYDAQLSEDYENGVRVFKDSPDNLIAKIQCDEVTADDIRALSDKLPCDPDKDLCN